MSVDEQKVSGVVAGLVEYLEWRKDEGKTRLEVMPETLIGLSEWGRPKQEAPAAVPAARTAMPVKKAPTVSPLETGELRFVIAERMPECKDELASSQTRLAIVSVVDSFAAEPRELLEKMLKAIGYAIAEEPQEMESVPQIVDLAPLAILSLGNLALKVFVPRGEVNMMRGRWKKIHGVDMLCTFDPVYIASQTATKKAVWNDLQGLIKRMELNLPDWVK